ncbi:hypothetical protein KIL84_021961 [Mauremys mutica]|uniref:Uncharacterized protein n=1 Tax=Mauremys mutica TaxID=74926 RepID=A0A9D3XHD7_9SAUR|nr:hypothetical protein KIL84_021961 [Mauremys mutica]
MYIGGSIYACIIRIQVQPLPTTTILSLNIIGCNGISTRTPVKGSSLQKQHRDEGQTPFQCLSLKKISVLLPFFSLQCFTEAFFLPTGNNYFSSSPSYLKVALYTIKCVS